MKPIEDMTDNEYDEFFSQAWIKWQNGDNLSDEEEKVILDSINDGDPMMGATT